MPDSYVLQIDPDPQLVPTARMFAATVARQLGCEEERVLDLKIAVSEACTNAVQAHMRRGIGDPVTLRIDDGPGGPICEVTDSGPGLDREPPEPPEAFRRAAEGTAERQGLGLALIRALFPSALFRSSDRGTSVRFGLGE